MSAPDVPDRARVVVIGGGIIGCSVAYHLAEMGEKDVVLLERDRLTSGTTWHAAGLMVTFGSTSETSIEMRKYTADLFTRLEEETGQSTGFDRVGFIEVASDADRLEEYRRVAAFNRFLGIDVHEISPAEVKELFPPARIDDIHAGFYVREDGRVNPVDATMAIAKGARLKGVRVIEGVSVTGVSTERGAVKSVTTTSGEIECEVVVNCAGMWAHQLGRLSGVSIPLQAAEHYYLLTEPMEEIAPDLPVLEDPGCYGYYRPEGDGLLIGLFEALCAPWKVEGIPEDFSFGTLPPDWDRMGPYLEKAMGRIPASLDAGVKLFFCGPESFTPDLGPIVGEAPEVKNYWVAAGLNSIGITTGGGLGRVLAHWILNGRPDCDVTYMNVDRLHPYQGNPEYRARRTVEMLGMVYQCHYPTRSPQKARNAKKSPFYDRLAKRGAYFRDVSGWEGADWYAPPGVEPEVERLSWGRENWFPYWEAEHRAAREAAIVMDMSFMSKFLVQGRDAGSFLNWISANRVNGRSGRITYTQWLDEDGKLQADLTVAKIDSERFVVVASDTTHRHVETWMRRHVPDDDHVTVTDVTGAFAQLNVQGPKSREVMQALTTADMSNDAFPFRTVREIEIGYARVTCVRITYLGELGYELYIPVEHATHVYDLLVERGEPLGLVHAGLKALASLRMEKGYRDYGHDIDNTDTVLEAGLGFAVSMKKKGGFLGKEAVAAQRVERPLKKQLVQILVKDPEPMMFHAEIVHRNDQPMGYIRAASYGHTLGGAVGLAMIEADEPITQEYLDTGEWSVDIAGERYPAVASLRPLYDPKMERVKS
jgi:4-methylaminobutanoate oxidase (formaldehyde-forming)